MRLWVRMVFTRMLRGTLGGGAEDRDILDLYYNPGLDLD